MGVKKARLVGGVLTLTKNLAYGLGMRKRLIVITFITGLLVTGCSSSDPEYDARVAQYQTCLQSYQAEYLANVSNGGGIFNPKTQQIYSATEMAVVYCANYKP